MSLVSRRLALTVMVAAAFTIFLAIGQTGAAQAADLHTVNNNDDTASDGLCPDVAPGDCTLRDAIDASNGDSGDVTINVPANTYKLTDGELSMDNSDGTVTVQGAGARSTIIDGQGKDRVLDISEAVVILSQLTITGGANVDDGGGIRMEYADVTLDHVAVTGNTAEPGPCNLQVQCFVSPGLGGGINNYDGTLVAHESLISDNTASAQGSFCGAQGGGIYSTGYGGTVQLTNTTISDNEALDATEEDGCSTEGLGGGVNIAGRYGFDSLGVSPAGDRFGTADFLNVTLADNTAGLGGGLFAYQDAEVSFKNTIAADNTANDPLFRDASDTGNCLIDDGKGGATATSNGHNLESDPDLQCRFSGVGDQQNTNPKLGALQNNTGQTDTRELLDSSPALDTADNNGCPGTDQRDVTRPQKVVCDIGAYEKIYTPPAQPAPVVAPAQAQAKPVAKASLSGPRGCVGKSARVRVRGSNIASVTYSLDGKQIKKAKGNNTSVTISKRSLKTGAHRVTARITFTGATAAKPVTKRFTLVRCAAAKPKFTG